MMVAVLAAKSGVCSACWLENKLVSSLAAMRVGWRVHRRVESMAVYWVEELAAMMAGY